MILICGFSLSEIVIGFSFLPFAFIFLRMEVNDYVTPHLH